MPLPLIFPAFLLLIQGAFLTLPSAISGPAAYIAMVAAPLLAAIAVALRGRAEISAARAGWYALAAALVIWALGAFGNLWQEWVVGRSNEMYRGSTLAFNLAGVPIAFVLAGEWRTSSRLLVRLVDAVMASALGYAFFLYTWATLTARGAPDDAGVQAMVWLQDAQNIYLALASLVRWAAANHRAERDLFRAICAYACVYAALIFVNNHFVAGDPASGPEHSSFITIAFALLGGLALAAPSAGLARRPRPRLVRVVRSASPILLAGALLIVSLFMIRLDYAVGAVGVLIAVLGYGVRTTATQVRHIERRELLRQERSQLQNIAWTDALTGVANRHFLDQALRRAVGQPLSVLMIDIDHFKLLNDHAGHLAGDACLRSVAAALQRALVRPGDVLARYGGEEFIVLLHDVDAAGALVVAERLRVAVESLGIQSFDGPAGTVTVSIGAANAASNYVGSVTGLVEAADGALYEAKRAGRNQVRAMPVG